VTMYEYRKLRLELKLISSSSLVKLESKVLYLRLEYYKSSSSVRAVNSTKREKGRGFEYLLSSSISISLSINPL
jgi:hypothetical protein